MPKEKPRAVYVCRECGCQSAQYLGRCPECEQFGTLEEKALSSPRRGWVPSPGPALQELSEVAAEAYPRLVLPFPEVNRVLGGGVVPGSLILLSGDPGIGKSTILLQIAGAVAQQSRPVLYVSGEESPYQVKLRAQRLGIHGTGLFLAAETSLEAILEKLEQLSPRLAIVDSIQTVFSEDLPSSAGSVGQIRECTAVLMRWAKPKGIPFLISGHVTKDRDIAGPMALEHMVDVVLYLEGEQFSAYRLLRGIKNRFGSTNEVGVFEMQEHGLVEVENPSQVFLRERVQRAVGSAVVPALQGTRPILVEIQALTSAVRYGSPRRVANGVDMNRLLSIADVLSKHLRLNLGEQNVTVSAAGGLRVTEPAVDLGIALAIASSLRDAPVDPSLAVVGEIGLSGELRAVSQIERRLTEVAKLGFGGCVLPSSAMERLESKPPLELKPAHSVDQAVRLSLLRAGGPHAG